jgi:hypothetical protein
MTGEGTGMTGEGTGMTGEGTAVIKEPVSGHWNDRRRRLLE